MRREELCTLKVRDYQRRDGVMHFRIEGKGDKVRYVPVATNTQRLMQRYLEVAKHGDDLEGPMFRPVSNNTVKRRRKALSLGGGLSGDCEALRQAGRHHRRCAWILRALAPGDGRDERPGA